MHTSKCDCEHIAHMEAHERTPNGNPGHTYQAKFADTFMTAVITPYGTFNVCKDCRNDCYHQFPEVVVRPRSEERQLWKDKYGDKNDI